MELYSTFHLQIVMTNYDDLGTLSILKFGTALGLYTEEFKEENGLHALNRHIHRSPSRCWDALVPGGATYNPSHSKASALPPSLRYLNAILAHTITGDSASDGAVSEGGHLYWPLSYSVGLTLRAPQHRSPRIILNPHWPDVSIRHLEHA
ncbi:hypothetical protein GOBAR_AA14183 [Gossypium barbadense]|uniref:Uncharacterized protein n=1 Tax=Gossypium barbadense TaxID=3634 RepID=A0A2P5XT25_GOSBA|nr:hypothetical protein GOBAR_AA14183 [Gossypium barbadense]